MNPLLMNATRRVGHQRRGTSLIGSSIACDERLRPYRQLAVRVLARAVLDIMDPVGSPTDRESARAFLAGSPMLEHWCHVAALDPDCVAERVERLTAESTTMQQRLPAASAFGPSVTQ
jgi:hypothetical protein